VLGSRGGARRGCWLRPRPRPAVAAPPAPPAPRSSEALESDRRATNAEAAGGANKAAAAQAAQTRDAQSERPAGPLSRAGQEQRPPRGAPSAECGARRGGSGSAAAVGGVEPGPGPEWTCVCEGETQSAARRPPCGRTWAGAAAREELQEKEEEEEGRAAAQRGPGAARAKPRPGR
jgi:hypothetical protein